MIGKLTWLYNLLELKFNIMIFYVMYICIYVAELYIIKKADTNTVTISVYIHVQLKHDHNK